MTISKELGRFSFNAAATKILQENAVETILLMWDRDSRKVGIRRIGKKDGRSYSLRTAKSNRGSGFAAKTFLQHIGYDYSETRAFACDWDEADNTFVFTIPEEAMRGAEKVARMEKKEARVGARGL